MAPAATSAVNSPRLWPVTTAGIAPAAFLPQAPGGDAGDQHGGLRAFGFVELFERTLAAQLPQVVAEHRRGFVEGGADHGRNAGELREHADRLGTLAGKNESEMLFDMGAKYNGASMRLAARFQEQRQ